MGKGVKFLRSKCALSWRRQERKNLKNNIYGTLSKSHLACRSKSQSKEEPEPKEEEFKEKKRKLLV